MGFLAKAATRRLIEPIESPITIPQVPNASFLNTSELVTFSLYRALLARAMRPTKSSWSLRDERVTTGLAEARSGTSILRVMGIPSAIQVSVGVPAPDCSFSSDWELQGRFTGDSARFAVTQVRTVDDRLANGDLFEEIRSLCVAALSGPVPEIEVVPGAPSVDSLVSTARVDPPTEMKELQSDYLAPVPESFRSLEQIDLPDIDLDGLREAMRGTGFPMVADPRTGGPAFALDGGAVNSPGLLSARRHGRGACLVVVVPEEEERLGRLRTFRAVMVMLNSLAFRLKAAAPASFRAVVDYIEKHCGKPAAPAWTALMREGLRGSGFFDQNFDISRVVPLHRGMSFPVGVVVRGVDRPLAPVLRNSRAWLLVRSRIATSGLRRESRYNNATFTTRRAVSVQVGDEIMPSVRYVHTTDLPLVFDGTVVETAPNGWFWETVLRSRVLEDGRRESVLALTGASRLQDTMMYGAEYLKHLSVFASLVQATDPTAELRTVLLRL